MPDQIKLQAKIDGYEAWAFLHLMERQGRRNHDLLRTIVREWFQLKRAELAEQYGVSRELWELDKGGNVRPMAKGRKVQR